MRSGRGFTLVEVLVALVIVAVLSAVTVPTIMARLRIARAHALVNELRALADGVRAFRQHVGYYPRTLNQLVNAPATNDQNICGLALPAAVFPRWQGPYVRRQIPAGTASYATPEGEVVTTSLANPGAADGAVTSIAITVLADSVTALEVDDLIDGQSPQTSSTISWTDAGAPAEKQVLLSYWIPIRDC
ncbi:MAG: prepilin-type N-terminal cleavage/methylation domain-containing protein [Gemmatimonadaceae bacterium]